LKKKSYVGWPVGPQVTSYARWPRKMSSHFLHEASQSNPLFGGQTQDEGLCKTDQSALSPAYKIIYNLVK